MVSLDDEPKFVVIGCGNAGGRVVDTLHKALSNIVDTLVIDTDQIALAKLSANKKILIKSDGMDSPNQGDADPSKEFLGEGTEELIEEHIVSKDMVFLIAGLCDERDTAIACTVARIACEFGIPTMGVVTPVYNENANLAETANNIRQLKEFTQNVISLDHSRLLTNVPEMTLEAVYAVHDQLIGKLITETAEMIRTVNEIDFGVRNDESKQLGIPRGTRGYT